MNYDNRKFGPPSWRKLVEAVNMFDHDKAKLLASKHQRYFHAYNGTIILCIMYISCRIIFMR